MEAIFITIAVVVLIALARVTQQWLCGQPMRAVLTEHDNPAIGIAMAGYLFGIMWTVTVLLGTLSYELVPDIGHVLLYGCLGLILLTAVALGSFRVYLGVNIQEQLANHNSAAAIVVAAVYIATSLTYSGGLTGEGGGFWIMLLFFLFGQLALLGITHLFRWLTSYDDVQEITTGNTAAAFALAGLLIAVALVVRRAVSGTYTGFWDSFGGFLLALLLVVILYPVRQVIVQWLLLGGSIHWRASLLDHEIAQDKNIAAGLLEATAYITAALFMTYML
ncbi:MAG: DUF350 domain-containing protein [Candidatus Tectimicrobiota bacterium]